MSYIHILSIFLSPHITIAVKNFYTVVAVSTDVGTPAGAGIPAIAGLPVTAVTSYSSAADVVACGTTSTRFPDVEGIPAVASYLLLLSPHLCCWYGLLTWTEVILCPDSCQYTQFCSTYLAIIVNLKPFAEGLKAAISHKVKTKYKESDQEGIF
jgi:hypothetical protein